MTVSELLNELKTLEKKVRDTYDTNFSIPDTLSEYIKNYLFSESQDTDLRKSIIDYLKYNIYSLDKLQITTTEHSFSLDIRRGDTYAYTALYAGCSLFISYRSSYYAVPPNGVDRILRVLWGI
jgi:hypothetical protein